MSWFATNLASAFLLPPFNLILLGTAGVLLLKRNPGLGKALVITTVALLYLLSIPLVADALLQTLEPTPGRSALENTLENNVQAIVVLGGGTYYNAPEYGSDTVGRLTLERIRYAARLHRHTSKSILASGGNLAGYGSAEAAQMKGVLEQEFKVPVKWVETASRNTRENAYFSFAMLHDNGVHHIALVTHAWHMPRATIEFERAGFKVSAAATGYTTRLKKDIFVLIPSAGALQRSYFFFHELIGMWWYRLTPAPNLP